MERVVLRIGSHTQARAAAAIVRWGPSLRGPSLLFGLHLLGQGPPHRWGLLGFHQPMAGVKHMCRNLHTTPREDVTALLGAGCWVLGAGSCGLARLTQETNHHNSFSERLSQRLNLASETWPLTFRAEILPKPEPLPRAG